VGLLLVEEGRLGILVVHPVVHRVEGLPLEDPLEDLLDDGRIAPDLRLLLLLPPDLLFDGVMIVNLLLKKDLRIRNLPPAKEVDPLLPNDVKDLHLRLQLNKFVEFFYGVIIYESFWPKEFKSYIINEKSLFFFYPVILPTYGPSLFKLRALMIVFLLLYPRALNC